MQVCFCVCIYLMVCECIYVCVSIQSISKNLYLTHGDDLFKAAIKVQNNFNSQLWLVEQIHQGNIESFAQMKGEFPRAETQWCCISSSPPHCTYFGSEI